MAKKDESKIDKHKLLENMRKEVRKKVDAVSFADSKYSQISDWINTGDYGINRIISGSVYKGLPSGRVTIFGGEHSTGKSYVSAKIINNAIKINDYDYVCVLDSEGGMTDSMFDSNLDKSRIEQILVSTIEEFAVQARAQLNKIKEIKEKDPSFKALLVLDSLGMLPTEKIIGNIDDEGRLPADQGSRAKMVNSAMQTLMLPTVAADTPFLVLNHVYDSTSGTMGKIQNQSGGKRIIHAGHVILQTTKLVEKNEDANNKNAKQFYGASILKFFTVKNRIVKPFHESQMYLNFSKGPMYPHFGILKPAIDYGFIINPKKGWYQVPSADEEKQYRKAEILKNKDGIWDKLLDQFDEHSKKDLQYSRSEEEMNEISDEQNIEMDIEVEGE